MAFICRSVRMQTKLLRILQERSFSLRLQKVTFFISIYLSYRYQKVVPSVLYVVTGLASLALSALVILQTSKAEDVTYQ